MKILLLSCSTGGGHDACQKALQEQFELLGHTCETIDPIKLTSKRFSNKVNKLYIDIVQNKPNLFKKVYHIGEKYSQLKIKSPIYGINALFSKNLTDYIINNNFDIVLATHLYPAETLTIIKKHHKNIHFINITTDYVSIPFWQETNPDYFIIGHKDLNNDFINKGIPKEKLLPFGIPVSYKFNLNISKQAAKQKLDLNINKSYILIMTGSMGYGNIDDIIKTITTNFKDKELLIICGHNTKLKYSLQHKYNSYPIHLYGFQNNIELFMKASDVILTKPGGLTSTETAVSNIPTILTNPIPGCENYNATFFSNHHMALVANNNNEIISALKQIFNNHKLVQDMLNNQSKYINKHACQDICNFIIKTYSKKEPK